MRMEQHQEGMHGMFLKVSMEWKKRVKEIYEGRGGIQVFPVATPVAAYVCRRRRRGGAPTGCRIGAAP